MSSPSLLLEMLRAETRELHEALHEHPLLKPLHQGTITLAGYHRVLQAFDCAYRQMEAARGDMAADVQELSVLDLIARDFASQGISSLHCPAFPYPAVETFSQLVGYLYVKEGSALGGQVISRHLERALSLAPGQGNHFFAGAGKETGARWRDFVAFLNRCQGDVDASQACAQAVAAFAAVRAACDYALGTPPTE